MDCQKMPSPHGVDLAENLACEALLEPSESAYMRLLLLLMEVAMSCQISRIWESETLQAKSLDKLTLARFPGCLEPRLCMATKGCSRMSCPLHMLLILQYQPAPIVLVAMNVRVTICSGPCRFGLRLSSRSRPFFWSCLSWRSLRKLELCPGMRRVIACQHWRSEHDESSTLFFPR